MDTDIFLERCENIEKGLHKLSNEFYHALDEEAPKEKLNDLAILAKEKIMLFEKLSADIEDEDEEEEIQCFNRYINKLKGYILKIEKEK